MHRCACVRLGQYRPRHGPTQGKKEARRCLPREPAPTTRPVYAGCLTVSEWSSSGTLCINGGWQCACFAKRTETNAQHARRCCTICRRYCVSDRLQLRLHSNIHLHTVSSFVSLYIYIPVDGNNLVSPLSCCCCQNATRKRPKQMAHTTSDTNIASYPDSIQYAHSDIHSQTPARS